MVRDSEFSDRNPDLPTITAEQTVEEMHQKISALVRYLSINSTKKEAMKRASMFLGITQGQAKSFVYRQAVRVDANLYLQVSARIDGIMSDLNTAMEAFTTDNLRQHGLTPANWTAVPADPDKEC